MEGRTGQPLAQLLAHKLLCVSYAPLRVSDIRRGVTRAKCSGFWSPVQTRPIASSPKFLKKPLWPRWHASPGAHYAVWYANFLLTLTIALTFREFAAFWGPCVADVRRLDTAQLTAGRDV